MSCEHDRPVSERPRISKDTWFGYALGAAIVTLVAYGFAAGAIFFDDSADQETAKALAPFGTALLAGVTFLTIVWRGVISEIQLELQSKQLAQQIDQLAQAMRQNDMKDAEYKLKILHDSAKTLSDREEDQFQTKAAIASLEILVRDPQKYYGGISMNILAAYLARKYSGGSPTNLQRSAIAALAAGAENGLTATDVINLSWENTLDINRESWAHIPGLLHLTLVGGAIAGPAYQNMKNENFYIRNAIIRDALVDVDVQKNCIFEECKIIKASAYAISENQFLNCDFSGAIIENYIGMDLGYLKVSGSFFYEKDPPKVLGKGDIVSCLRKESVENQRPEPA